MVAIWSKVIIPLDFLLLSLLSNFIKPLLSSLCGLNILLHLAYLSLFLSFFSSFCWRPFNAKPPQDTPLGFRWCRTCLTSRSVLLSQGCRAGLYTSVSRGLQRERTHPGSEAKKKKNTVKSTLCLANFYLILSFCTPKHPSSMESCIHHCCINEFLGCCTKKRIAGDKNLWDKVLALCMPFWWYFRTSVVRSISINKS